MDLFKEFAANIQAEEEGTWEDLNGLELLIAREGNKTYQKLIQQGYEKNKSVLDRKNSKMAEAKSEEIIVDALARSILLGWRVKEGAKDEQGQPMTLDNLQFNEQPLGPYTVARAKEILGHPQMKDFRKWVGDKSRDFDRFRAVAIEEAAGE